MHTPTCTWHCGAKLHATLLGIHTRAFSESTVHTHAIHQALCKGLAASTSVTYVDLRSNAIMDEGARHLAALLNTQKTKTIKTLCVEANRIGDGGVEALCESLAENFVMTRLALSHNNDITR